MPNGTDILTWLHLGDLHITRAGEENHRDLLHIVELIQQRDPGSRDVVLLPGDTADDGTPGQFALVRDAVGVWLDKHVLGTQPGPNRNGRTW